MFYIKLKYTKLITQVLQFTVGSNDDLSSSCSPSSIFAHAGRWFFSTNEKTIWNKEQKIIETPLRVNTSLSATLGYRKNTLLLSCGQKICLYLLICKQIA